MTACIVLSIFREIKIQKKTCKEKKRKNRKNGERERYEKIDREYMRAIAKRKIELLYMCRLRHRVLQNDLRRSRDDVGFNEYSKVRLKNLPVSKTF